MYNAKGEFIVTKIVLCCLEIVSIFVAMDTRVLGLPVHKQYFPEQTLVSVT